MGEQNPISEEHISILTVGPPVNIYRVVDSFNGFLQIEFNAFSHMVILHSDDVPLDSILLGCIL